MIYWSQFSWEAAAGFAAVLAALVVGWRQATLQEFSSRVALFERRYEVYKNVSKFLLHIIQHRKLQDIEVERAFTTAQAEASFLFDQSVVRALDEIWTKVIELNQLENKMEKDHSRTGKFEVSDPEVSGAALSWISAQWKSLPELFHVLKVGGRI